MPETSKHDKDSAKVTPGAKSGDSAKGDEISDTTTNSDATSNATPTLNNDTLEKPPEFGGQKGLEPTRYGDWEKNGRCTDF